MGNGNVHARYILLHNPKQDKDTLNRKLNYEFISLMKKNLYSQKEDSVLDTEELALKAIILKVVTAQPLGEDKLKQYDLAYKWQKNKAGVWEQGKLKEKESPQVLFIERDVQLLADYGRMAIVLPDGVFGNDTFGYIRHWLKEHGRILAIIDIPVETFQPNTSTKTSILVFQKLPKEKIPEDYDIFMAIASTCGHDRRGNETESDEIQLVAAEYKKWAIKQGLISPEE